MPTKRPTHARPGATAQRSTRKRGVSASTPSARPHRRSAQGSHGRTSGSDGMRVPTPRGGELLLTRRHFLYGAIGVGALAAAGVGIGVGTQMTKRDEVSYRTLTVPASAVTSSEDCETLDGYEEALSLAGNYQLPYGTLVWASDDALAACLLPTETGSPLTQVGVLSLSSGTVSTVLQQAVGHAEGFEIYDVRLCSHGIVWTEADILDGVWRVYSAALSSDGTLGTPALAEEGDGDWETPTLAAVGSFAFWQALPRTDGAQKSEPSRLRRAAFGSADAEDVLTSPGRFCTPPYALSDSLVVTPRTDAGSIRYRLTKLDAASGETLDTLVLPSSMKPLEAGYGKTGFLFSFDAIYNYGDGIANLGTYAPAAAVSAEGSEEGNGGYSNAPWFRFARTPTAAPAWCGDWLMVKGPTAVTGVDLAGKRLFSLSPKSGADDYGEYLASTGTGKRLVTYANIDYQPIDGEEQKYCNVRVWEAV